jgi:hypothetical protein
MVRAMLAMLLSAAAVPALAGAQTASPDTELRLQKQPRRVIVSPRPAPETAARDAERVRKQIEGEAPPGTYAREMPTRPPRRPDLDRDVVGGIQSRSINSLRR